MISLEQIRLLEEKITRAIDLIRVLKEENATLRRGLDSAQRRMKELEGLVSGFKSDQKEIESVILRALKNLDDLEESTAASGKKNAHEPQPDPGPALEAPPAGDPSLKPPKGELDIF
jgi:FtsZ-binding cell division protein ZapB